MTLIIIIVSITVSVPILFLINKKLYKNQKIWDIAIFKINEGQNIQDVDFANPIKILSPKNKLRLSFHYITGFADPFLFIKDELVYLFYEQEIYNDSDPGSPKSTICAKRTADLVHWDSLGPVLKEQCHLSFPFVFEYDGNQYMIPETRELESVNLYRAKNFPYDWEKIESLLVGDKYVDSSIRFVDGCWYLFTTVWHSERDGLKVFVSDSLFGPYHEHVCSPVNTGYDSMRCGGSVFEYDKKLFRPAQYDIHYYGENLSLYEITVLSPTDYEEQFVSYLIDKNNNWSQYGGHHFSIVHDKNSYIIAMDGRCKDNYINNRTRKFFNLFHRIAQA